MRGAARLLAGLVLACLVGGCGYSVGLGGNLPSHIKTVAVPIFVNSTQQPAVESVITAAVINAFVTSGRLKVVSVREADSILEGDITGYNLDSIAYNPQINVTEYRLRVRVNILFRDIRQNTTLWKQDGLEQWADFRVQGQVSETLAREDAAARPPSNRPAHRGRRRPVLARNVSESWHPIRSTVRTRATVFRGGLRGVSEGGGRGRASGGGAAARAGGACSWTTPWAASPGASSRRAATSRSRARSWTRATPVSRASCKPPCSCRGPGPAGSSWPGASRSSAPAPPTRSPAIAGRRIRRPS